ncbi:MAG: type IV toxin-antitoxin system AbiEi family antitoxin [Bacteriovoracaceae bacterium]|nr:type IV toxin-antitoxin system AbiEi family antitoxin [Bacteriovoracaceae bacterium]
MVTLETYIKDLRAHGRSAFTTQKALSDLGISHVTLNSRVYRLKKKGELISPAKNLFVIIPPEYRALGCLPPAELIPILMKYWKQDYYAGLLTAALYHGASHQKPQIFQVVVNKQIPPIVQGKVSIEFITKKSLENLSTQDVNVKTGYLKISSPEVTSMDLLLYTHRVGGLNAIATILSELIESIDSQKLTLLAKNFKGKAWVQRLGWILENIDSVDNERKTSLINALQEYLLTQQLFYVPAASELETLGCTRNKKWMIIENTTIESDYDT